MAINTFTSEKRDNIMQTDLVKLLEEFPTISLKEMNSVRLMNRIDTKYLTDIETLKRIISSSYGEYMVQEVNGCILSDYVTCYFDTEDYDMYLQHQRGMNNRTKVRVRRYIDSDIMFLEVKRRNNKGRTDKRRIQISDPLRMNSEQISFLSDNISYNPYSLIPRLENRFRRITMVNMNKSERLTIDISITFHNISTQAKLDTGNLVVIELKRNGNTESPIKSILKELMVHPSGFSKYCIGASLTDPLLKQNRFKMKQHYIEKITTN
jgi:hypothetical protein